MIKSKYTNSYLTTVYTITVRNQHGGYLFSQLILCVGMGYKSVVWHPLHYPEEVVTSCVKVNVFIYAHIS